MTTTPSWLDIEILNGAGDELSLSDLLGYMYLCRILCGNIVFFLFSILIARDTRLLAFVFLMYVNYFLFFFSRKKSWIHVMFGCDIILLKKNPIKSTSALILRLFFLSVLKSFTSLYKHKQILTKHCYTPQNDF